ncbi:hypothetical protein GTY83_08195 [Streptomyces sp. SID4928]|uniref:hypothetical protein n=1 Tax=Streptomyces TaxID=1883 RepID=UPI0001C1AF77|nr:MULTISPECIES: hypothetical protein [Streptomyces]MYR49088.1 hypothetical protein [Streptomyces sp. SID4928]MYT79565.1 hypothetical protein [Streptomyces sp. SID8364]EGE41029.1 hypothetical protein SACT1_1664 [Streptomyces sp. ACT-1]SBV05131.1 hypothetical protein YW3DRAFT_02022 [Streptomyces sp. MnatMP-M77]SCE25554.1 hypothetical protein GA0115261_104012 [Streptomyces sp. OspMP-M43]
MTTTLPVPIAFELPDGWRAAPPDGVGAPGAAFVALHPHPDAGFTANITVDGAFRPDPATLPEIADESVANLRGSAASVDVAERREVGSEDAPGLTQTLAISAIAGGVPRDLIQSQVYLSLLDVEDPGKRAVIRLILTVTAAQHGDVVEDFRDFVRTVRPDTP